MKQINEKPNRFPVLRERLNILLGNMSTKDFAEKVGLTRQTMGFYLNGDRIPDSLTLAQICKNCNVSADWLLGFSDDPAVRPCAVDDLGLSTDSVNNILQYSQMRGFEECMPGLNLLLEDGAFFSTAALVYRLRNLVSSARNIEYSFSKDTYNVSDGVTQRMAVNYSIVQGLEAMICEKYPYLNGHFRIIAGDVAVRKSKDDVVKSFDSVISRLTEFDEYIEIVNLRNDIRDGRCNNGID